MGGLIPMSGLPKFGACHAAFLGEASGRSFFVYDEGPELTDHNAKLLPVRGPSGPRSSRQPARRDNSWARQAMAAQKNPIATYCK
ncbi:hypothetical protein Amsp01_093870 [Amycolatopsis sp. NBRC 101858]|nr:hypothetical protein Amsp01_093870 [Amycolatopsis sp. NBRC 101858]